jgi:hypothetical protein
MNQVKNLIILPGADRVAASLNDGEKYMQVHVANSHGSKFEYLVYMEKMQQVVCHF